MPRMQKLLSWGTIWVATTGTAFAQIPDVLTAFDAGGRALGAGGVFNSLNGETLSGYFNPAGLGFIEKRELGLTYRNLPTSTSRVDGTRANPVLNSRDQRGSNAIAHVGVAIPLREALKKGSGTVSLSYTIGGNVEDVATGPAAGLPDGAFTLTDYQRRLSARSEFFTVAYGKTNAKQNLSFGFGLAFVQQQIGLRETTSAAVTLPNVSETGSGIGVIVGAQYVPPNQQNISYGVSLRTPINLQNNEKTSALYDQIPGRVILGASYRKDDLRGGRDFLVLGTQVTHFFQGQNRSILDRNSQTLLGFGLEYNIDRGDYRLPIRVGYTGIPGAADQFGQRNSFNYGIGYRPNRSNYGIDLNYAVTDRRGYDFALSLNYRF